MNETRYRISVKQTTKGLWTCDATIENYKPTFAVDGPKDDLGNTTKVPMGHEIWRVIDETIEHGRKTKHRMAEDEK